MIGNGDGSGDIVIGANGGKIDKPWYGDWLQVYTACVATAVLAMIMAKKQKLLEKNRDVHMEYHCMRCSTARSSVCVRVLTWLERQRGGTFFLKMKSKHVQPRSALRFTFISVP